MIELPDVFSGKFNGTPAESEQRNEAARAPQESRQKSF